MTLSINSRYFSGKSIALQFSKSTYRSVSYGIKVLLILLTFFAIWYKVTNNQDLSEIGEFFNNQATTPGFSLLLGTSIILMVVNWAIETLKWQLLVEKIEPISFWKAFKAIFSGITISLFTPNRIGEYAGRVLYVKHRHRIAVALATLVSSIAQVSTTLILGFLAFYFFFFQYLKGSFPTWIQSYVLVWVVLWVALIMVVFTNSTLLLRRLSKWRLPPKIRKALKVFGYYSFPTLIRLLAWSMLRYVVFSIQYFLLLWSFDVHLNFWEFIVLIPMTFLSLTIIPSIALAELGIREIVALHFVGLASDNDLGILSASFFLWFINLAFPGVIGSLFLFRTKIFKSTR